MTQPTELGANPRLQLIEDRLGTDLAAFVAARRPALAWRRIANELTGLTGVDVTGEALRNRFGQPATTASP